LPKQKRRGFCPRPLSKECCVKATIKKAVGICVHHGQSFEVILSYPAPGAPRQGAWSSPPIMDE
jgi:hypothetical protein